MNYSETVFVLPKEGRGTRGSGSFSDDRDPVRRPSDVGTAFVLAAPLQLDEVRLETGAGLVPVKLERDGSRIAFGWMEQPVPTFEPYDDEAALLEGVGVERSDFPSRSTTTAFGTSTSRSRQRRLSRPCDRTSEHLPTCRPSSGSTASPARAPGGRPGCSRPATVFRRIPQPVLRPARSPFTSRHGHASSSATRSRSRRAPRSDVRPRSSPASRARRAGRGSRSAAPR